MDDPGIKGCQLRLLSGGQFAEIAITHFLVIADRASFQNSGRWKPIDKLIAASQIVDECRKEHSASSNVAPIVLSAIETRMKLSSVKAQPKTCGLCLAYQELAFP